MAEGGERHKHLELTRAEPVNPRRTGGGRGPGRPSDPKKHGAELRVELDAAYAAPVAEPGFDPRRLLKLQVEGLDPSEFAAIPGLELISQEGKTLVVLFASDDGVKEFRARLDLLARGHAPTRQDILFAVKGVSAWGRDDRIGPALRVEGLPDGDVVSLDVELWPLEKRGRQREPMLESFVKWCAAAEASIVDRVNQDAIVLYRLRVDAATCERLLHHRDVRTVDLPPRLQLSESDFQIDINELGDIPSPPDDAPAITVLDTGVATNHPLLAPAMGDAQTFIPNLEPTDDHGHGTAVAGLALYGDVAACMATGSFVPRLRLFSGRITDRNNENNSGFLENHITEAVKYFTEHYGCRIFNLSVGDRRKPFTGGHVRGLAVTVDTLSRDHNVLFVVSAGNYEGMGPEPPPKWRAEYPRYLLDRDSAHIIDPAPALNALTVGSLVRYEQSRMAQRHPQDPAYQPAARFDQPSPFSRSGPGPGGAVKPEVVAYGGNYAVDLRDATEARLTDTLLGEPAPSHDFATSGRLLRGFVGTSFAAPHVAYLAARLASEYPAASNNVLRALIVAHAAVPEAASTTVTGGDELRRLVGYGRPQEDRCMFSRESCVSLIAEAKLGEDQHHFFELPLPEDFLVSGKRHRTITVALAHTPFVRTTRFDYRGSRMKFRLVAEKSLDAVARVFKKTSKDDREDMIQEFRKPSLGANVRDKGTVQAAAYEVRQLDAKTREKKLFVVVTRIVPGWAQGWALEEPYALAVVLEDRSEQRVRYYQQIVELQQRARARVRR